ncbi:LD34181p [Strongyloides ratti]|uniref:LD34181p n=1 Tax=Strongyloides ratti TaxID=34506 RepID=A0A090L542_STRRB|nr:LD34181p [Strongyloides ratti]CEF63192.1 LD34181p [Strongyloides ratti]
MNSPKDSNINFVTPAVPGTRTRKRRATDNEEVSKEISQNQKTSRKRSNNNTNVNPFTTVPEEEISGPKTLYGKVKSGKNVGKIVDEWIDIYDKNPEGALQQMCQFLISSSGCKGVLTLNFIKLGDFKKVLALLTECFEDTADYPLVSSNAQYKKFKQSFGDFLLIFASKSKANILFDSVLMDGVCQLLTAMADSPVRAFRHTSTYASMKLCSAFVDIIVSLVDLKDKNKKQIDTATSRMKNERNSEALELLMKQSGSINERISDLTDMMSYMFKSIFVHRYRDVVPEIRIICITQLGLWMLVYPEYFLTDSYLKYISWSVYDTVSDVRLACLNALIPLYEKRNNSERLELFTSRFLERICSMVSDVNVEIACKACYLLKCIYKILPSLLDVNICEPIYEYVFTSHRSLAIAAAQFLSAQFFKPKNEHSDDYSEMIPYLVMFLQSAGLHNHADYFVDAMIDVHPMLKDWNSMIELLLSDKHEDLDVQLCNILACAVKQACTGESPPGRIITTRRNATQIGKDIKMQQEERIKLSEIIIPHLATLMQKFISNEECLADLIHISTFIDVDLFMTNRWEKYLEDILQIFDTIIEQSINVEILSNIVLTIHQLQKNISVNAKVQVFHQTISHRLTVQLKQDMGYFIKEPSIDKDEKCSLISALTKVYAFLTRDDLGKWNIWEIVTPLFKIPEKATDLEIVLPAFKCLVLYLTNQLKSLVGGVNSFDGTPKKVKNINGQINDFYKFSVSILKNFNTDIDDVYHGVVDTLILVCNNDLYKSSSSKVKIGYEPDSSLVQSLIDYLNCHVFDVTPTSSKNLTQEESFALVSRKREILASFCKLIVYGCISFSNARFVLPYFNQYSKDFGDIIKTMMQKCRDIDKMQYAKVIAKTLVECYDKLKDEETNQIDTSSKKFMELKDLAKKFHQSFGIDPVKNRNAVSTIHRDGILFSMFSDENIQFLEILFEFSSRLLSQDKEVILSYLMKHCKVDENEMKNNKKYESILLYKQSLM